MARKHIYLEHKFSSAISCFFLPFQWQHRKLRWFCGLKDVYSEHTFCPSFVGSQQQPVPRRLLFSPSISIDMVGLVGRVVVGRVGMTIGVTWYVLCAHDLLLTCWQLTTAHFTASAVSACSWLASMLITALGAISRVLVASVICSTVVVVEDSPLDGGNCRECWLSFS